MALLPEVMSSQVSGMVPAIVNMFIYGGIIAVLIVVAVMFYLYGGIFDYKIGVTIHTIVGDTTDERRDKGAIVHKGLLKAFKFQKTKPRIQPMPNNKYFYRKGKKLWIDYISHNGNLFPVIKKPIVIGNPEGVLELVGERYKQLIPWNLYVKSQIDKTFDIRALWDKYGQIISLAVLGGIMIIMLSIFFKNGQANTDAILKGMNAIADRIGTTISNTTEKVGSSAPW